MKRIDFNKDWKFNHGINTAMAAGFTGSAVEQNIIDLPHDAMITAPRSQDAVTGPGGGFFWPEDCEYTKVFTPEGSEGDIVYLEFDGVYTNASVLVNGDYVGGCWNGYSNFLLSIGDYLRYGQENQIKVVVKNAMQPNGRWYTGAGIYRDVNILYGKPLHILPYGTRVTTLSADDTVAALDVETQIVWNGSGHRNGYVRTAIKNSAGEVVCEAPARFNVTSGSELVVRQRLYIHEPALWNVDTPNLYTCESNLQVNGDEVDCATTSFGIRTLQLDSTYGLRINDETIDLKGGCIHHDNGLLGAVSLAAAEERRVRKLKEAGYNALRSSHNPASRALLDACDKLGMLMMDEFSDAWSHPKIPLDYGFFMPEHWEADVKNMVRRGYNHPCIIFYSIGNEIPETGSEMAAVWGRRIAEKIRSLDKTRFITNGINVMMSVIDRIGLLLRDLGDQKARQGASPSEINDMMNNLSNLLPEITTHPLAMDAIEESCDLLDVVGFNYSATYETQHEKYPQRIFLGSETIPPALDVNWELVKKHGYVIGDFAWTCWDYLGEVGVGRITEEDNMAGQQTYFMGNFPWLSAYTGDFDLAGYRRPISYWRETVWNGRGNQPFIAVHDPERLGKEMFRGQWSWTDSLDSWTWPGSEGKRTIVEVYSAAEEVELIINGKSLGRKPVEDAFKKYYCKWEASYEPGRVEAIAYMYGDEVGRCVLKTAGPPQITLSTDRASLTAGTRELCFVEIRLLDQDGTLNMAAENVLRLSTEGPGILLASGSGNPCTEERFYENEHRAFQGRMLAIVGAGQDKGIARLTVSGEGLTDAVLEIPIV